MARKSRTNPSRPQRTPLDQPVPATIKPLDEERGTTTRGPVPVHAGIRSADDGTRLGQAEKANPHASGVPAGPSQEAIAVRAYALFLGRGSFHGDDWADWLQAEAELRAEQTLAAERSGF